MQPATPGLGMCLELKAAPVSPEAVGSAAWDETGAHSGDLWCH